MKNLVKKLVLSVLVACTVITAIPVTNAHAEIKPYKKYKQLWIDLDKTTPEKYIDMVHKYGKKGIKEKVQYYLGFKVKGKTDKQVIKKVNDLDKRVQVLMMLTQIHGKKVTKYQCIPNVTMLFIWNKLLKKR